MIRKKNKRESVKNDNEGRKEAFGDSNFPSQSSSEELGKSRHSVLTQQNQWPRPVPPKVKPSYCHDYYLTKMNITLEV